MPDYRKLKVWQKAHSLSFTPSSVSELEYHLLEAKDIRVIGDSEHHSLSSQVVEVRMMLHGLLRRLEGGNENNKPE